MKKKILILGGTTESSALIKSCADQENLDLILSLAGVTKNPVLPPQITTRIGGFGGIVKMAEWIKDNKIDKVVDATHPFAQQITHNAYQATQMADVPYLRLERPAWVKQEGDIWHEVMNVENAVMALGTKPLRVFVTIGRKELLPFKECSVSHHYWIRSVDRPDDLYIPKNASLIQGKGPFSEEDEINFLKQHQIDYIVSKNSGGKTIYAKISAARKLNIPIMMIQRPVLRVKPCVTIWQDAYLWIME